MSQSSHLTDPVAKNLAGLAEAIRGWAQALGFASVAITEADLPDAEEGLKAWLLAGYHGQMDYMSRHAFERAHPDALVPGTTRVISLRMNYWPDALAPQHVLADSRLAYVSRYALGRDYHKVLRLRLQKLVDRIQAAYPARCRVFVDSAPVLEAQLAQRAGLGWRGKHTLLLNRDAGSYFFLGEIFIDLPLPVDLSTSVGHCGRCVACLAACPTGAIVAPGELDARRCISYLTIEHSGSIPEALRPLLGNRIYGCDDCQLVCPWNRFARSTEIADFAPRHGLDGAMLTRLFAWTEDEFLQRLAGSPIRRIGHARWLRNIAVALGNAAPTPEIREALAVRKEHPSALVREHVAWAIEAGKHLVD